MVVYMPMIGRYLRSCDEQNGFNIELKASLAQWLKVMVNLSLYIFPKLKGQRADLELSKYGDLFLIMFIPVLIALFSI